MDSASSSMCTAASQAASQHDAMQGDAPQEASDATQPAVDAAERGTPDGMASAVNAPLPGAVQDPNGRWLLPFGVTTYTRVFSDAQLQAVEEASDALLESSRQGKLPSSCFHVTASMRGAPKRTKFFFGARCVVVRCHFALSFVYCVLVLTNKTTCIAS